VKPDQLPGRLLDAFLPRQRLAHPVHHLKRRGPGLRNVSPRLFFRNASVMVRANFPDVQTGKLIQAGQVLFKARADGDDIFVPVGNGHGIRGKKNVQPGNPGGNRAGRMPGCFEKLQLPAAKVQAVSLRQRFSFHVITPGPVQPRQRIFASLHPSADFFRKFVDDGNGPGICQHLPTARGRINLHVRPVSFQIRNHADMIKMSVQNDNLFDFLRRHSPRSHLTEKIRKNVRHAGADQDRGFGSFQQIHAGFLRAQKPETVIDSTRLPDSHDSRLTSS